MVNMTITSESACAFQVIFERTNDKIEAERTLSNISAMF